MGAAVQGRSAARAGTRTLSQRAATAAIIRSTQADREILRLR
jgi:hypothetical protein